MKRLLIICLALIWLIPSTAMAHSKMETSIPAQGETINVSPELIEMSFDTKIEKISNFKLLNAAGEQMETERATVDNDTMTGAITAPLENGEYTVQWTIIGADGHAVEGKYSFTVDAPVLEVPVEEEPIETPAETPEETPAESNNEQPSAAPEPTKEPNPDQNESDSSNADNSSAEKDKEGFNSTPIVIIIGIIIIAAAIILLLRRRK